MTRQPARVQRTRTKGHPGMPPGAVYVGRGRGRAGRFGNPFTVPDAIEIGFAETTEQAREICTRAFRSWLRGNRDWWMGPEADATRERILAGLPELRGRDLACWCPLPADGDTDHCHAAVLLLAANDYGAPAGAGVCDRCWQWDAAPERFPRCPACGLLWSRHIATVPAEGSTR